MNIRTLLLGTATAITMVGGAQAADLAVAEPVDYVKVCDAYGAGYFYIPGTDTCLKVGGFVRSWIDISDNGYANGGSDNSGTRSWQWTTEPALQVTAQSMTDIGLLTGFLDYRAELVNGSETFNVDSAYLKAGPLKLGYFTNIYNYGGGFLDYGAGGAYDAADNTDNQLVFSTSAGGMGFWLGIADNQTHNGGSSFIDNISGGTATITPYSGSTWPDVIVALTGTAGGFDWKLAGAVTDVHTGPIGPNPGLEKTGWGVQAAGQWTWANGDGIRAKVAVGNRAGSFYVDSTNPLDSTIWGDFSGDSDTIWSALVSGVHYWSSTFGTALTAGYTSNYGGQWDIGAEANWTVAKGFLVGLAADYYIGDETPGPGYWGTPRDKLGKWSAQLRLTRSW